jgi:hypothetical protein
MFGMGAPMVWAPAAIKAMVVSITRPLSRSGG